RNETSMTIRSTTMLLALALAAPLTAEAQKPIKVGFPMILSGPGALFGEPALKGAQMYVDELNAKGGDLGRPIELVVRDTKGNADEAVRVSRELILRENVDFLVGTLTSAEGPAVSVVAKENRIVFIAPIPKTDQLTAPDKLHPYVFRVAATTTMEGRPLRDVRQAGRAPRLLRRHEAQRDGGRRSRFPRVGQGDGQGLPGRHLGELLRRLLLGRIAGAPRLYEAAGRLPEGRPPVV